jgi:hypothetical protein
VAGGVGTTTIAFAVSGEDRGVYTGGPAEVLVCHATGESVVKAAAGARLVAEATGQAPVLVVTAVGRGGPSRAVRARLGLIVPHVPAVVLVPHVPRWREIDGHLDELRAALTAHALRDVPRPLRRFVSAVSDIRHAVHAFRGPAAPPVPAGAASPPSSSTRGAAHRSPTPRSREPRSSR